MKKLLMLLIAFLASFQLVEAVLVKVDVAEKLDGKFTSVNYKSYLDLTEVSAEFYNTGSLPYKARVRLDVYNGTERIFTGWSKAKVLTPGDRKLFFLYFYTNSTGNFTMKIRAYFGNEIQEEMFVMQKNTSYAGREMLEIRDVRVYENFAVLELVAREDVGKVFVIPKEFPKTWVVEQGSIESMQKGSLTRYSLNYVPDVWVKDSMTILFISEDGKYVSEKSVALAREKGVLGFIRYLVDVFLLFINPSC